MIINIPLPGGLKFNVFFDDGEAPIDNAMIVIKSQDGEKQRIGNTNEQGDTLRYWLQSTTLQKDYYTAEVFYDDYFLTSVSNIKLYPGMPQNQKIVVPIPETHDLLNAPSAPGTTVIEPNISKARLMT